MRHTLALLGMLAAGALAACGSSSTSSGGGGGSAAQGGGGAPAGGGGTGTGTVTGNITLTGFVSGNVDFSKHLVAGLSCSAFTQYGNTGAADSMAALTVDASVATAANLVDFSVGADNYHGSGDYDNGGGQSTGAFAGVKIDGGKQDFAAPDSSAPVKVTMNGDGSGKATFSGLADMNGGSAKLAGSVTWTCS